MIVSGAFAHELIESTFAVRERLFAIEHGEGLAKQDAPVTVLRPIPLVEKNTGVVGDMYFIGVIISLEIL